MSFKKSIEQRLSATIGDHNEACKNDDIVGIGIAKREVMLLKWVIGELAIEQLETTEPALPIQNVSDCTLCGKSTSALSGNPYNIPMELVYKGGNGKTRTYCQECVINVLDLYSR